MVGPACSRVDEFFRDEENMALIVGVGGIAEGVLEIVGNVAAKYIPFVTIATSPFYINHALDNSVEASKMVGEAAKAREVAEVFFWFGRSLDAMGSAIGELLKPFSGGFEIANITSNNMHVGFVFATVIPIALMVIGAIGTAVEAWATTRTIRAIKEFEKKSETEVKEMLTAQPESSLLKRKIFEMTHFTSDKRQEALQKMALKGDDRVVAIARSEMHRVALYHVIHLVAALTTLTAGTLLFIPQTHHTGVILAISSGSIEVTQIIFNKTVSQQKFFELEQKLLRQPTAVDAE